MEKSGFFRCLLLMALVVLLWTISPAWAISNKECLQCHGEKGLTKTVKGEEVSLFVEDTSFEKSVHGSLPCADCHADVKEIPHKEVLSPVQCKRCHGEEAEIFKDSVHGKAIRLGRAGAASCKDCHGKHDIKKREEFTRLICKRCHQGVYNVYTESIHGKDAITGIRDVATCHDCHGEHNIYKKNDPRSTVYHLNLPQTCAKCHANPELIKKYNIPVGNAYKLYMDSIHGRAITKSGLLVAANCSDCHGSHEIKPHTDPKARIYRGNIPSTCGTCHAGITATFEESSHGTAFKKGNTKAPVCIDCHTAHQIQRIEVEAWKLDIVRECGTCHEEFLKTYRDTYHGQVTSLGFTRVARCSDCHGSHNIFPPTHPLSTLSRENKVITCRKCHPKANVNFVKYDPHADPHNKEKNPALYYSYKFMHYLLIGVFAFFAPHTLLWLFRSLLEHKKLRGKWQPMESDNTEDRTEEKGEGNGG